MIINLLNPAKEQDVRNFSYKIYSGNDFSVVSGTGFSGSNNPNGFSISYAVGTASGLSASRYVNCGSNAPMSLGQAKDGIDWSKGVILATRLCKESTVNPIDSNVTFTFSLGKPSQTTYGNLTTTGVGIKFTGSGAMQLMVHNGTSLTVSTDGTYVLTGYAVDIMIQSDGKGNAVLYANGVQVASCSGAPTSVSTSANNYICFDATTSAVTTASIGVVVGRVHLQIDI